MTRELVVALIAGAGLVLCVLGAWWCFNRKQADLDWLGTLLATIGVVCGIVLGLIGFAFLGLWLNQFPSAFK